MKKTINTIGQMAFVLFAAGLLLTACGGGEQPQQQATTDSTATKTEVAKEEVNKGIGPIKELKLEATIDKALAEKGKAKFEQVCVACHKATAEKLIGPGLKNVTKRRQPEWIMNMVLNPTEMLEKDKDARQLLAEHNNVQMTNQNLTQEEARAILEYFRQNDAQ